MTTTPETPALPGDLTDETIERALAAAVEVREKHAAREVALIGPGTDAREGGMTCGGCGWQLYSSLQWLEADVAGHEESVEREAMRAALAAAHVATVAPSETGDPFTCTDLGHEDCDGGHPDHRPAPRPDHEKPEVFDALRNLLGTYIYPSIIDTGRGDINDAQAVTTELAEAVLALFAVPPVVNEAKLAEVLSQHAVEYTVNGICMGCGCRRDYASHAEHVAAVLVERQREWLGEVR